MEQNTENMEKYHKTVTKLHRWKDDESIKKKKWQMKEGGRVCRPGSNLFLILKDTEPPSGQFVKLFEVYGFPQ